MSFRKIAALFAVSAVLFGTCFAADPPVKKTIKKITPPPLPTRTLQEGDIVFISLHQKFLLLETAGEVFPEVDSIHGNLVPHQWARDATDARCRILFEKSYAPPHGSYKTVNPAADPGARMYFVHRSVKGEVTLMPAMGEWNDYGPPTRELSFIDPVKQKAGVKLNDQDLQRLLVGVGNVGAGNRGMAKILANLREALKNPPQEFPKECPDEAAPAVATTAAPEPAPAPPEVVLQPLPPLEPDHDEEVEQVKWWNDRDWVPPPAPPPLTSDQTRLIADKLQDAVDVYKKIEGIWSEESQTWNVMFYLQQKQESGEFLSIDEADALAAASKRMEELNQQGMDYFSERNQRLQQLCNQFPDNCGEIWNMLGEKTWGSYYTQ